MILMGRSDSAPLSSLDLQGILFLVECPACEENGYRYDGNDPKLDGGMHPIDADERDKDCAAGATQNIRNEEAFGGDRGKPGYVAHQVTGEDGQDEGKEVKDNALMLRGFVPALNDLGRSKFVDQVTSVPTRDRESDLTAYDGTGDDDEQTQLAVDITRRDHQRVARDDRHKDLRNH